jgi:hypothetical protein
VRYIMGVYCSVRLYRGNVACPASHLTRIAPPPPPPPPPPNPFPRQCQFRLSITFSQFFKGGYGWGGGGGAGHARTVVRDCTKKKKKIRSGDVTRIILLQEVCEKLWSTGGLSWTWSLWVRRNLQELLFPRKCRKDWQEPLVLRGHED